MEAAELKQLQEMSLEEKITYSLGIIRCWYEAWQGRVYVSFSGGKDSTVLLHLVRMMYPDIPAVFIDTGLEYPEIRSFVRRIDNVVWLKPKKPFYKIVKEHGYPVISKEVAGQIRDVRTTKSVKLLMKRLCGLSGSHTGKLPKKWHFLLGAPFKISEKCCYHLKKAPVLKYEKTSGRMVYLGDAASNSSYRKQQVLLSGCNAYESKRPVSRPLAIWTERDIWAYKELFGIEFSSLYSMGWDRSGCMFCMFGVHLEDPPNRFQRMKETHPKHWEYCIHRLGLKQVLDFIGVPYE